ncbi:RNA-guided endonuclease InsQ/TnpB family protein [Endozoicomonas euniceicola]|uniref:Transposase n=1 Tax=Endozoicomonas euniceicola TaxID=1234143 RepID=A0ABY6H245_9GAMM|nr:transposase [Endozoicomonas euniceicola]UYM18684.1 transposase [Endozoicomonas euniceicola]
MLKATKIRIYPTPDQAEFLNRQFGAVRMVWNKALAIKTHYYKIREQNLSPKKDLKPLLSKAKKSRKYSWLKEADSMALQQSVINLDKAFQNFFNPKLEARFPRFKSKHGKQSSYHCTSVSTGGNWIKIPKCKPIKARVHREITDNIKSITLTMTPTGKYYASVLAEDGKAEVKPVTDIHENHVTGVDVGLTDIVITSNGVKTGNPRFIKNAQRNLKRKQKKLSRCKAVTQPCFQKPAISLKTEASNFQEIPMTREQNDGLAVVWISFCLHISPVFGIVECSLFYAFGDEAGHFDIEVCAHFKGLNRYH